MRSESRAKRAAHFSPTSTRLQTTSGTCRPNGANPFPLASELLKAAFR